MLSSWFAEEVVAEEKGKNVECQCDTKQQPQ